MADEQRLNSVDRFRKQPGQLILEEHGHCEVPAGCGGVVLRWRNPSSPLPVTVTLYTPVEAASFIDGAALQTGKVYLAPGTHVVAVVVEGADLSAGLIMFAAVHDPKEYQRGTPGEVAERPLKVVSEADGSWKFTLKRPTGDDWLSPSFDDRDWDALTRTPAPRLNYPAFGAYACSHCRDQGATCLKLPVPSQAEAEQRTSWWQRFLGRRPADLAAPVAGSVWIRKVFQVPAPQFRQKPS
jgi:hypothetical protein